MKKRISKLLLIILTATLCITLAACNPDNKPGEIGGSESETAVFNITFNVNGGSAIENSVVKVKKGSTVSKPSEQPVKRGFEFQYWSANSKDEYFFTEKVMKKLTLTAVYKAKIYEHNLNLFEEKDKDKLAGHVSYKDESNNNIDFLTSIYDSKKVIIGKSDSSVYDPDEDTANDTLAVPVTDVENDYFVYWYYKDKNGEEIRLTTWANAPEEGKDAPTVEILNAYSDISLPAPELFAKWHSTLDEVDFRFYANTDPNDPTDDDGSVLNMPTPTSEHFKLNDKAEAFSTIPTRNGYTFDGWFYKVKETVDDKDTWVEKDFVFLAKDADGNEITDPAATAITEKIFTKIGGTDENPQLGLELYARWRLSREIKSASDWNAFAEEIKNAARDNDTAKLNEYLNADVRITSSLSLGTVTPLFGDGLVFKGTFDGGKYSDGKLTGNNKITCSVSPSGNSVSLIGNSQGKIRNVDIECGITLPSTEGETYVAGLASINTGTIERCKVSFSIVTDNSPNGAKRIVFGGVSAKNSGIIADCEVNFGNVSLSANYFTFGGIAAENSGTVQRCLLGKLTLNVKTAVDSSVTNDFAIIGGIAGNFPNGLVSQCRYQDLNVDCGYFKDAYAGGFVGFFNGSSARISESFGSGKSIIKISADNAAVGGIAGRASATGVSGGIQKCYSVNIGLSATSKSKRASSGGVLGDSTGRNKILIDQCYAHPDVKVSAVAENGASAYAGGLIGSFDSLSLSNSFSLASVELTAPGGADTGIGYVAGGSTLKDGQLSADKLYFFLNAETGEGVNLTKNGVKFDASANDGKGNFDLYAVIVSDKTVEKSADDSNFMDNTWLEDNAGFITDKEKDGKPIHSTDKIIWHCGDKSGNLPTLIWYENASN